MFVVELELCLLGIEMLSELGKKGKQHFRKKEIKND
jgi:hypothetical protein